MDNQNQTNQPTSQGFPPIVPSMPEDITPSDSPVTTTTTTTVTSPQPISTPVTPPLPPVEVAPVTMPPIATADPFVMPAAAPIEPEMPASKPKSKLLPIIGGVAALLLVVGVAGASYYVSNQLSTRQAVAPNAPESKPAASSCGKNSDCASNSCIRGICAGAPLPTATLTPRVVTSTPATVATPKATVTTKPTTPSTSNSTITLKKAGEACGTSSECASNSCIRAICSGAELPKKAAGEACGTSSECASNSCIRAICSGAATTTSTTSTGTTTTTTATNTVADEYCPGNGTCVYGYLGGNCHEDQCGMGADTYCRAQANGICCRPIAECGGGPTTSPTASPTVTPVVGACMNIKIYKRVGGTYQTTALTTAELQNLKVGDVLKFGITSTSDNLKGRFKVTVAGTAGEWLSGTIDNSNKKLVTYSDYTISTAGTYKFEAQVTTVP